jgi:hypothetical protein
MHDREVDPEKVYGAIKQTGPGIKRDLSSDFRKAIRGMDCNPLPNSKASDSNKSVERRPRLRIVWTEYGIMVMFPKARVLRRELLMRFPRKWMELRAERVVEESAQSSIIASVSERIR